MSGSMEWHIKALTPIWTGDVHRRSDRLIPTGLMGSLRWWYEVLVRGLGGEACDPTVPGVRCPDPGIKDPTKPGHHCVACELFGCTGWARKFRLMVLKENGEVMQEKIEAGTVFILRFIPLRPIRDEEWCLLDLTLRLIAQYGATGGKTVFKPSDEPGRAGAFHHKDFGLISVEAHPSDLPSCTHKQLEKYVQSEQWRKGIPYRYRENGQEYDYSWASLDNFWCVKGRYLARQSFTYSSYNRVIGRNMRKNQAQDLWQDNEINLWLAGSQQESKKVFSFREPKKVQRTFGFIKPRLVDFDEMKRRLRQVWQDFNPDEEFLTCEHILRQLFQTGGEA